MHRRDNYESVYTWVVYIIVKITGVELTPNSYLYLFSLSLFMFLFVSLCFVYYFNVTSFLSRELMDSVKDSRSVIIR